MPTSCKEECEYLPNNESFATKGVHAGMDPETNCQYKGLVPPLIMSTTFRQNIPPGGHAGYEYARCGNPTRSILQDRLAALDEAKHCIIVSSGMAATNLIMQLVEIDDHIVVQADLYHGCYNYFKNDVSKKAKVDFVDSDELNDFKLKLQPDTKLLWCETPTNPFMKLVDLEAVVTEAKKIAPSILIVVDNTFMSPYFQRPLMFGVDIVMHSCSKYIAGHSDILMGAICLNDDQVHERLNSIMISQGPVASPFDCYIVLRSLSTLELRMKKHMSNGLAVAKLLEKHPMIEKVMHPGLESHPQHKLALKQTFGCSGMLSVYVKNHNLKTSAYFLEKLCVINIADSLGGIESTVKMPSQMPAHSLSEKEMKDQGLTDGLLRFSIGIESEKDLLDDLQQALDHAMEEDSK